MTNLRIINMETEDKAKAIFFNVLVEMDEEMALVIPGWKIHDGRIYLPSKSSRVGHFATLLASESFCRRVQEAVEATNTAGVELEHDAYASSKWGQKSLQNVAYTEAAGMEIWRKYRKG